MNPLVSIIIPTFNRAEKVIRTLDSIISQSYGNIEIIVVDDGSTDDTEEKLFSYTHRNSLKNQLFYYKQENGGAPSARNYGLKKANGTLIVFFDSDDLMLPDRILKQVTAMLNEGADCCSCGFMYSMGRVEHIPKIYSDQDIIRSYMNWDIVGSTVCWMYKRDILLEIGGYDLNYSCYQDWDITFRYLTKCSTVSIVGEVLNIIDNRNEADRITSQINSLKRIPDIQRFFLFVIKWSILDGKNLKLANEVLFSYVHQITLSYFHNKGIGEAKKTYYSLNNAIKEGSQVKALLYKTIFFKHLFKTFMKSLFLSFKSKLFQIDSHL